MANVLNKFFMSVFTKEPPSTPPAPEPLAYQEPLLDIAFTPSRVKKKLEALQPNSAPGPDKIMPRFLKLNADSMSVALSLLYNVHGGGHHPGRLEARQCDSNILKRFEMLTFKLPPSIPHLLPLQNNGVVQAITDHLYAIINPLWMSSI